MPKLIQRNSQIEIHTPYDASFVSNLKLSIPHSERKWQPDRKIWLIEVKHLALLERLVRQYFTTCEVTRQDTLFQTDSIQKFDAFLIEYVARAKDGYALAWARNGFTVRFAEKVLRDFFEMGFVQAEPTQLIPTDYYAVLGVKPEVNQDQIRSAWRRGLMQWHPDKCSEPDAREWFDAIQAAYEILKEPNLRLKYNAGRKLEQLKPSKSDAWSQLNSHSYVPPVRCGLATFEAREVIYLDVVKILAWEDDIRMFGNTRCVRIAMPKRQTTYTWHRSQFDPKPKSNQAEDFFRTEWVTL